MAMTQFRKKMLSHLIETVKNKTTITYEQLGDLMGLRPDYTPQHLAAISEYTFDKIGLGITAIVVNKDGVTSDGYSQWMTQLLKCNVNSDYVEASIRALYSMDHAVLNSLMAIQPKK